MNKKRILSIVIFAGLLFSCFAKKSKAADTAYPKSIVALSPSAAEILFAVGAGDQVAAVSEYTDYPAEAAADAENILSAYLESYDHSDDNETWFGKIRQIAVDFGYAAKPKDFKKHPEEYKGHVGHVSTVIRIALMGRATSPDVWAIQQIMGEDKVRERIGARIG